MVVGPATVATVRGRVAQAITRPQEWARLVKGGAIPVHIVPDVDAGTIAAARERIDGRLGGRQVEPRAKEEERDASEHGDTARHRDGDPDPPLARVWVWHCRLRGGPEARFMYPRTNLRHRTMMMVFQ